VPIRSKQEPPVKAIARNLLVAIAVLLTLPLWLPARISIWLRMSDDLFATCSQIVGIFPGVLGVYLRRGFYRMTLERCAWDCRVGCSTWFSHPRDRIGKGVYIGGRCSIGMCDIGDDVLIGDNVDILSGRRQHRSDDPMLPRNAQRGEFAKVWIGRNTWIGNSAVVMADIGDDSVVGAGSVVVKPIPPGSVAAGNPATVKKPSTSQPQKADAGERVPTK
jgi:virginiamycin A acetyltransferase